MTENEAKKIIINFIEDRINFAKGRDMSDTELKRFCQLSEALKFAVTSLEEIQQYRLSSTLEECRKQWKVREEKPYNS